MALLMKVIVVDEGVFTHALLIQITGVLITDSALEESRPLVHTLFTHALL